MKKLLLIGLLMLLTGCNPSAPATPTTAATDSPATSTESANEPTSTTTTAAQVTKTDAVTEGLAAEDKTLDHVELLNRLLFDVSTRTEAQAILTQIKDSGDTRFVAGLIDTLRYQRSLSLEITETLTALTGEDLPPDWFAWVEWAGQHPEIESFAEYPGWKANLFAQIDPRFLRFVHQDMKVAPDSHVEEIVWGGVRVDGIPALDNPTMIEPEEADYLVPNERVFGVSINGDTRAYPARFLDWHEMFNDIVGGEPVSLAY